MCIAKTLRSYQINRSLFEMGPVTALLNAVFNTTTLVKPVEDYVPDAEVRFIALLNGVDFSTDGSDQSLLNDAAKKLRGHGKTSRYLDVFNANHAWARGFKENWVLKNQDVMKKVQERQPGIWEAYAQWADENEFVYQPEQTTVPTLHCHIHQVIRKMHYGDMDRAIPGDYPIVTLKQTKAGSNCQFPLFALNAPNDPLMNDKMLRKALLAVGFISVFQLFNRSTIKLFQLQFGMMEPLLGVSLCARLDQLSHGRPINKYNYGGKMDHFLWNCVWLTLFSPFTENLKDFVLILGLNLLVMFIAWSTRPYNVMPLKERLGWDHRKGKDRRVFFERFNFTVPELTKSDIRLCKNHEYSADD